MSYRRRHRWFRRLALGLAFASVMFAGRVSVAAAKFDEGVDGSRYASAGGWSGLVDLESGVPLSAGIPEGDEQFIDDQAPQVIPYLSHGLLTEDDARTAAAESIGDPNLSRFDVPSLGRVDGDQVAMANALADRYAAGVTDFPSVRMDIPATRPDDVADRFAHSDVPSRPELASDNGSSIEWNEALTAGIGAFVLVLGLGLAFGYLKRPKLAGL